MTPYLLFALLFSSVQCRPTVDEEKYVVTTGKFILDLNQTNMKTVQGQAYAFVHSNQGIQFSLRFHYKRPGGRVVSAHSFVSRGPGVESRWKQNSA